MRHFTILSVYLIALLILMMLGLEGIINATGFLVGLGAIGFGGTMVLWVRAPTKTDQELGAILGIVSTMFLVVALMVGL